MKISLCGYLNSGCTEVAENLASKLELETVNTSSIIDSIKDFESLSRSGEVDLDMVIKTRLEEILKRDNVIVEGRSAFMLLDRKDVTKIFLNASAATFDFSINTSSKTFSKVADIIDEVIKSVVA